MPQPSLRELALSLYRQHGGQRSLADCQAAVYVAARRAREAAPPLDPELQPPAGVQMGSGEHLRHLLREAGIDPTRMPPASSIASAERPPLAPPVPATRPRDLPAPPSSLDRCERAVGHLRTHLPRLSADQRAAVTEALSDLLDDDEGSEGGADMRDTTPRAPGSVFVTVDGVEYSIAEARALLSELQSGVAKAEELARDPSAIRTLRQLADQGAVQTFTDERTGGTVAVLPAIGGAAGR